MLVKADCVPCLFRQALNTARIATSDANKHARVLRRVAEYVVCAHMEQSPAAFSGPVYRIISEETGVADVYSENKKRTNNEALKLLPMLRDIVKAASDPLDAALHIAAAGNIIDMGVGHAFDVSRDVSELMKNKFAIDDVDKLRGEICIGRRVLYIGDNAGEIVFDMLLVKELQRMGANVVFVVKSGPIINDATMEDAISVGMTELTEVIETGGVDIGVNWNNVSEEFISNVKSADCVIAKGHGNFETCDDRPENFYFLLKAKCPVVAGSLKCRVGDIVCAMARRS